MAQTVISVRVDEDIKKDAEAMLEKLGMNISTLVNSTLRQLIMDEAMPFQPKVKHKRKSLDQYLEEYHGKDIETILREAEESGERPTEINWGKPVGEEVW